MPRKPLARLLAGMAALPCLLAPLAQASEFPDGFVDELVVAGFVSASGFQFTPDGRIFLCERDQGRVRVLVNTGGGNWSLLRAPFHTFDIPRDGNGNPVAHRSIGLYDIAFDPNFAVNGYVYAYYMNDTTRQNRIVRVETSVADPNVSDPGSETILMDVPSNDAIASGSHNGGGVEFGGDGKLYFSVGDGWTGADPVQELTSLTGKVFRINPDGTIPGDNPFFGQTTGDFRAIFCIGLRNPYSITKDPATNDLYVHDVGGGPTKASTYLIAPGANFGHMGYGGIGVETLPFVHPSDGGYEVVTGGAFYPAGGNFPTAYHGALFTTLWSRNAAAGGPPGGINTVASSTDPTVLPFATDLGVFDSAGQRMKPIHPHVGPDGHLYYMLTIYNTTGAQLRRVRWTGAPNAATPSMTPGGGSFEATVEVALSTATGGATIFYTVDGAQPTQLSTPYDEPFLVEQSTLVRARAFESAHSPSSVIEGLFTIGEEPNLAPLALASADRVVEIGDLVVLSSAASLDPDGDEQQLSASWEQISGPRTALMDPETTTASFRPAVTGRYAFRLTVSDGIGVSTDETRVAAVPCYDDVVDELVARWSFERGMGEVALDGGAGIYSGAIEGPAWSSNGAGGSRFSLEFDGTGDSVQIENIDVSGSELTLTAWIRADDFGVQDGRILSRATGEFEHQHFWMISTVDESGSARLQFRIKAGGLTQTLIADSGDLTTDRWTHVAALYNGTTMRLFKDGHLVGAAPKSGTLDPAPTVGLGIGAQSRGAGFRAFDGLIDDVRVYSRSLTVRELRILARKNGPRRCAEESDPPELRR